MRLVIDDVAKSEIREAARVYEGHRPGLGAAFREERRAVMTRIRESPLTFQMVRKKRIRRANLSRFPYSVFFIVEERPIISIIAVMHQKRDPSIVFERS